MQVVDDRDDLPTFQRLRRGQFFLYKNITYIKTTNLFYGEDNAYNIEEERNWSFNGDELVQPIQVEIHIIKNDE